MNTVSVTVEKSLCCSCGVCKGICPKNCIEFCRKDGIYLPVVDESVCVSCGLCAAVCPGLGHPYAPKETAEATVTGTVLECYNAWSRDEKTRHVSASGGVISTLIPELLQQGKYDGAFSLDSYDYRSQLKTRRYSAVEAAHWADSNAPKSRYLPVSQEEAVRCIREHPKLRIIIVGTSCALRGIDAAIRKLNRDRENYLLIGLFCDKVFNYNVLEWFSDSFCPGNPLERLHFKNKESGGWPGDMKFFPERGDSFYVPLKERARMKQYFMPERCLYCVDKLNVCADISLGDNYTGRNDSKLGSNSVIIRTQVGKNAWEEAKDKLVICDIGIEDIQKAQAINWRLDNLYCGDLKTAEMREPIDLNPGVQREKDAALFKRMWKLSLQRLKSGACYNTDPIVLKKQIRRDNKKPNPVVRFMKRSINYIKRRIR